MAASAPVAQIKASYYRAIRDCHPDITGEDDNTATEFCVFLNEIYEVGTGMTYCLHCSSIEHRAEHGSCADAE